MIIVGWTIAASFGMYDFQGVSGATWAGIPSIEGWHRFGFDFGKDFWARLPAFLVVGVVPTIIAISNGVAIQQVCLGANRAQPTSVWFRAQ